METNKPLICEVFRSPKDEGLYLYVDKSEGLRRVPEALLEKFGKPQAAMTMLLKADKKLARADAEKVIAAIEDRGYYLQLPPAKEDYMQQVNHHNSKLF
ncbi:MAG: YcgL domain-containing protein [Cellvibrionaceae bacterium]|nr:YcgL domain-containing protein [Cellvibrionaceae bacterium]